MIAPTGQARTINGRAVSSLALGAAGFSFGDLAESESIQMIRTALDSGMTVIDTAYVYTRAGQLCHNESLIGRALKEHPGADQVLVATKGGHYRCDDQFLVDGRPESLRVHCERSLSALGLERIGLYQLHMPDPATPLLDSVQALIELRAEGKIDLIGLSNVTLDQLKDVLAVTDIASVQNHFSPMCIDDRPMIDFCAKHGIAYLAYSPLGGAGHLGTIAELIPAFAEVAVELGVSIPRLALAWMLDVAAVIIPVVGVHRPASLQDSIAAVQLELGNEHRQRLDDAVRVPGLPRDKPALSPLAGQPAGRLPASE